MVIARIVCVLFVSALAFGQQTRVREGNIEGRPSQRGKVWVVVPNGFVMMADLDTSLVLDLSGPVPILRATLGKQARFVAQAFSPTAATASFTLSDTVIAGSLHVYRNGLLMADGIDYSAAGAVVTFLPVQLPQGGDVIQFRYSSP